MNITRFTITIRPSLLERLRLFAREHERSISDVIEEGISRVISEHERKRLDRMYQTLSQLKGKGRPGITDASTTINEVLYTEHGKWKGADEQL
jgi:predicted CopG family antitoxin